MNEFTTAKLKGRLIDLRRQRELYSLQNHGLRRCVPVDCFYEGENMLVRVTSQREIENLVRSGEVKSGKLKLRMPLSAEMTPLKHVVEETVAL